ncbi:MAG: ATP-binding protein [Deltaproteobacteria bacterium]|nr:ATP-binding protein [Deltaproteobacteria bacterium]
MNTALINALKRQAKEVEQILKFGVVGREKVEAKLRSYLPMAQVKVILGPRRAGKSTLALKSLRGERFAFVSLEDEVVLGAIAENDELMEALELVEPQAEYYVLDEIQNLPNWEIFVNRQQRRGKNMIITGSNSKLLSKELASSLTGRHIIVELFPFNFEEYCVARSIDATAVRVDALDSWMELGGFPEVVLQRTDPAAYLRTLFDAVILRDVVNRHRIRNTVAIRSLANLLINSVSSRFSARSLERALHQVGFATIQKYLGYLHEAYLFFELQAFSYKTRQRISSTRKIYTVDNGFVSACSDQTRSQRGALLENAVFVELLRRGHVCNLSLFYVQTSQKNEVDFFLPNSNPGPELIQVCTSLDNPLTVERELRALRQAAREFGAKRLTIITLRDEASYEVDGTPANVVPLISWLREV